MSIFDLHIFVLAIKKYNIIDTQKVFGNNNPVYLEVGCGKGGFVCEMASKHPEINFLAVEKISNVLICAMEKAIALGLKNVVFLNLSLILIL